MGDLEPIYGVTPNFVHELSVAEAVLEITLRHAEQANARRVVAIDIVIGQLASIVDDSLQFYWDIISKDSIARGALLNFHRKPAKLQCKKCDNIYPLAEDDFACPLCHSDQVVVVVGEEFYISTIDIE